MKQYIYKNIAIAGTFDRLHKGHKYFISEAFKLGEKVIIGLTSDEYVKQKFEIRNSRLEIKSDKDTSGVARRDSPDGGGISRKVDIQNYQTRRRELEKFLDQETLSDRAEIVKIDDVYGPAVGREDIEALIVTSDTLSGGQKVNIRRRQLGLKPLKLLKVPLILAEDQKRIASTRIRLGEIDRWGRVLKYQISNIKYQISDELRLELKKPLGELIRGDPNNLVEIAESLKKAIGKTNSTMISTVGDEVTKICNQIGITINLAIIDFRVGRKKKYHSLSELGFASWDSKAAKTPRMVAVRQLADMTPPMVEGSVIRVTNPPGHITKELVSAVNNAYLGIVKDNRQRIIEVTGEEDLAGLPAILLAPLGSVILYGQPGAGVVMVEATEAKKQEIMSLVNHCI